MCFIVLYAFTNIKSRCAHPLASRTEWNVALLGRVCLRPPLPTLCTFGWLVCPCVLYHPVSDSISTPDLVKSVSSDPEKNFQTLSLNTKHFAATILWTTLSSVHKIRCQCLLVRCIVCVYVEFRCTSKMSLFCCRAKSLQQQKVLAKIYKNTHIHTHRKWQEM